MMDFDASVNLLIDRIVGIVHPIRIIIFGSAARKQVEPESDMDFLVIMPEGTHRRATAQKLYEEIVGAGIPFDILIATPSDIVKHKDNIGLIYRSALREGNEVYAG